MSGCNFAAREVVKNFDQFKNVNYEKEGDYKN